MGLVGVAFAGSPLGGAMTAFQGFQIGITLGSLLFPQEGPKIDSGRLNEIRVQNASQGTPISIVYGKNRIAGTVIWASGFLEREETTGGGGGCFGLGGGAPSQTNRYYSTSMAIGVCEGPVTKIRRIWANEKVIYDWRTGGSPAYADWIDSAKVRIYDGTQTLPDSAIEADKGAGNVPAFMGLCYVVFEDLQLSEVGNQIPNFTFEVETAWSNLRDVMLDVADRAGILASRCDFSSLASYPVPNLIVGARTEAGRIMDTCAKTNFFDMIESGGKLKAKIRTGTSVLTIPAEDIGANADDSPEPFVTSVRAQEVELPREFEVSYNSEAQDFQTFTQRAKRQTRYSENQDSLNVPMAIPDAKARFLADALLMEKWVQRTSHSFSLPYKYLKLDPGDVISIPDESGTLRVVRILEMNAGILAQIEVTAVDDDPGIYVDPGLPAAVPDQIPGDVITNNQATMIAFETNAPYDELASRPYLGFAGGRIDAGWSGGRAESDVTIISGGGAPTTETASFVQSAAFGYTTPDAYGALGSGASYADGNYIDPVRWGTLDTINKVRVTLASGTLSSVTYDEMVLNGKNLAIIGREILHFQTATLISGTTYELSNLIRYRRGTDYVWIQEGMGFGVSHDINEPFVLLDSRVKNFTYSVASLGLEAAFRLLESGRDYSGGLPSFGTPMIFNGATRKPYGPCLLKYTGDRTATPSVDLVLSWTRRARVNGSLQWYTDVPLDETVEKYEIEIWNDDVSGLYNTYTVTGATSFAYTQAARTLDGTDSLEINFVVYQVSSEPGIGRGYPSQPYYVGMTEPL